MNGAVGEMIDLVLFPSSYFNPKKVDEDMQAEYDAVVATGLFDTIFFSYDKWFHEGKLSLTASPDQSVQGVYRGWMMQPKQYAQFYEKLLESNIELITKPAEYNRLHVFPNVYEELKNDTPKMLIFPQGQKIDVAEIKRHFKRFMVKDYVKSVKGTEFPKYFDDSITQEKFDVLMEIFYKYRGKLFTGGICIKEYLDLRTYGGQTNEYRVYYMNHNVATIARNSGQGSYTPMPPRNLLEKYMDLESSLYTIDFAELVDGTWKIIEAGDGEVSGLSENQDYEAFFRTLYHCFEE